MPVIPEKLLLVGRSVTGIPWTAHLTPRGLRGTLSSPSVSNVSNVLAGVLVTPIYCSSLVADLQSESPFASDAGEGIARYEVPIYCGLASVCLVVAQGWASLRYGR